MKKLLSALLMAAVALSSVSVAAFAAVDETRSIEELCGAPIDENGRQYSSTGDTIAPGQTIYFLLPDEAGNVLANTNQFRISTRKNQNSKLVKTVSVVEKRLTSSSGYYIVPAVDTNNKLQNTRVSANGRNKYLAVTLNDSASIDEAKVDMTITFTARKAPSSATAYQFKPGSATLTNGTAFADRPASFMKNPMTSIGDKLTLRAVFYVGNPEAGGGDTSVSVGAAGMTVRPVANEQNEVIFETSSDELARLNFKASSNPSKFLAKLSTKWTTSLSKQFYNNDAVVRKFNSANIDAVSRANLALVNPFDDDVNPSKVYIYTITANGALSNISSQFTYNEDDNTFECKTRSLGTYILSVGKASPQK